MDVDVSCPSPPTTSATTSACNRAFPVPLRPRLCLLTTQEPTTSSECRPSKPASSHWHLPFLGLSPRPCRPVLRTVYRARPQPLDAPAREYRRQFVQPELNGIFYHRMDTTVCICSSQSFLSSVAECMSASCDSDDLATGQTFISSTCAVGECSFDAQLSYICLNPDFSQCIGANNNVFGRTDNCPNI